MFKIDADEVGRGESPHKPHIVLFSTQVQFDWPEIATAYLNLK